MFGPTSDRKIRGKGKKTRPHEDIVWRADPSDLQEIRNLSLMFGGQKSKSISDPKTKASMNNIISMLLNKALNDQTYIDWLQSQFPSKSRFVQFYVDNDRSDKLD